MIAYARKDLPIAVARFDRAYELDSSACDATWMSGLVSIDQNELAIAAPKFTRGMSCFVSAAAALRQDRARREAAIAKRGTPPTAREQAPAGSPAARCRHRRREVGAVGLQRRAVLRADRPEGMAMNLIDVAIAHPKMSEKAIAMKAAIEKLPN